MELYSREGREIQKKKWQKKVFTFRMERRARLSRPAQPPAVTHEHKHETPHHHCEPSLAQISFLFHCVSSPSCCHTITSNTHTHADNWQKETRNEMKKISKSQGPASETISNKSNQTGSSSSNGRDFSVLLSLSFVTWHNCQRSSLNWSAIQSIKGRLCCIVQCIDVGPSQSAVELL